jgi:hypothetical protein
MGCTGVVTEEALLMTVLKSKLFGNEAAFFKEGPLRSPFFLANTALLLMASALDGYALVHYHDKLDDAAQLRLIAVLLGMWLLWRKAWQVNRKVRNLLDVEGRPFRPPGSAMEDLVLITATITRAAMFFAYALSLALLAEMYSLLWRVH